MQEKALLNETRRHAIASLLRIPHHFCINKMDLVDYKQEVFEKIMMNLKSFSTKLEVNDIRFVPISALKETILLRGQKICLGIRDLTLLYLLETIHIASDYDMINCRFRFKALLDLFPMNIMTIEDMQGVFPEVFLNRR